MMSRLLYAAESFKVDDRARLDSFVDENSFGLLLSSGANAERRSSWLPFVFNADRTALLGHLARANPQWRDWKPGADVSVVFLGPHAYVSPKAYAIQPSVPTWNYATVRVDGSVEIIEDERECIALVSQLVEKHEGTGETGWRIDFDSVFAQGLLRGIVCFRIRIDEIYGSFKMSQNKPASERERVIRYLRESGDGASGMCADFMEAMD